MTEASAMRAQPSPAPYRQRLPMRSLVACLLFTLCSLGWLSRSTYQIYHVTQSASRQDLEMKRLEGVIRHLDEVLTMSARMAAVTGDLEWEARYHSFEPTLDRAIKAVGRHSPEALSSRAAAEMDDANLRLVAMETRAFELLHQGNPAGARDVLFGPDYDAQKLRYATNLDQIAERIAELGEARAAGVHRVVMVNLACIAGALVLLAIGWLVVLRVLRRWQGILTRSNQELAELNTALDQRVMERTQELERLNAHLSEEAQERQRVAQRLRIQNTVANILAESVSFQDAMHEVIRVVCQQLGWELGAVWFVDPTHTVLRWSRGWREASLECSVLEETSQGMTIERGAGLPGQIWNAGRPVWIPDVLQDASFLRGSFAEADGLHAAFGFPIRSGNVVLGVMEFFSHAIREPEPDVVELFEHIGNQIGLFVDRKRAQDEWLRLAAIVESSDDAILGLTLEGVVESCNLSAERLLGYAEHELKGQPFIELFAPPQRPELQRMLAQIAGGESVDHYETTALRTDGAEIELSLAVSPIKSAEGKIIGLSAISRDIAERKRLEREQARQAEALKRHNAELVNRDTVTRSLLEDLKTAKSKLEQQAKTTMAMNDKLQELSAVKDEFVAKASHELRTPLTAIKEGVSLIADGALGAVNAEQLDFLKTVDGNIDRLTELINNLLDISKMEAGRLRLFRKPLDLRQLIDSTLKSYRAIAGHRTLRTVFADAACVFADSNRILQVLGNLFSNAIKFTPDAGTITFGVEQRNGAVVVSVSDDGIGIAKEDLAKLFQKFSQVGEGENRPDGTGLGLALCKELIQLHKGEIEVTSDYGKGTAFTFTLPAYTPAFALEESFYDLTQIAQRSQQSVAVIALDGHALLERMPDTHAQQAAAHLEELTDLVRRHVHRGDVVLSWEPHWVMLLAITDATGVQAMIQRLRGILQEWLATHIVTGSELSVAFGAVLFPDDGLDVRQLVTKATTSLNSGLAAPQLLPPSPTVKEPA